MSFEVFTLPDGSIWGFPVDISPCHPLQRRYLKRGRTCLSNDLHPDDWNWNQVVASPPHHDPAGGRHGGAIRHRPAISGSPYWIKRAVRLMTA